MDLWQSPVYNSRGTCKPGCDVNHPMGFPCADSESKRAGYQHGLVFAALVACLKYVPKERKPYVEGGSGENTPTTDEDILKRAIAIHPSLTWPTRDIISLVVQNVFPSHEASLPPGARGYSSHICGSWIQVLPQLATTGPHGEALTSAIHSFGIAMIAKGCNGLAPFSDALSAHESALQLLQQALGHVRPSQVNELSVAIMCLRNSELILPIVDARAHRHGLARLMHLNGPEFYMTGVSHQIFDGARPSLLIQAICTRRPTFLSKKEWQTIPYRRNPPSTVQRLVTEALPIPCILQHIDGLGKPDTNKNAAWGALVALNAVRVRLEGWYKVFLATTPFSPIYCETETSDRSRLIFPSLTIANSLTYYWSFWIICATYIHQLRALLPEPIQLPNMSPEMESEIDYRKQVVQMSRKILDSVYFMIQDSMKLFGSTCAALPLKVAFECLSTYGDENDMALCYKVFEEITLRGHQYLVEFASTGPLVMKPVSANNSKAKIGA